MGFEKINSVGKKYYLHQKGHLMYFSGDPKGSVDLPSNLELIENPKTKLPMVRKKKK